LFFSSFFRARKNRCRGIQVLSTAPTFDSYILSLLLSPGFGPTRS
jgi:hypothetical protein